MRSAQTNMTCSFLRGPAFKGFASHYRHSLLRDRCILYCSSSVQVLITGSGKDEFCLGVVPDMNGSSRAIIVGVGYANGCSLEACSSKCLYFLSMTKDLPSLFSISTTYVTNYSHYLTYFNHLKHNFNSSSNGRYHVSFNTLAIDRLMLNLTNRLYFVFFIVSWTLQWKI